jgi:hypothetical protein
MIRVFYIALIMIEIRKNYPLITKCGRSFATIRASPHLFGSVLSEKAKNNRTQKTC